MSTHLLFVNIAFVDLLLQGGILSLWKYFWCQSHPAQAWCHQCPKSPRLQNGNFRGMIIMSFIIFTIRAKKLKYSVLSTSGTANVTYEIDVRNFDIDIIHRNRPSLYSLITLFKRSEDGGRCLASEKYHPSNTWLTHRSFFWRAWVGVGTFFQKQLYSNNHELSSNLGTANAAAEVDVRKHRRTTRRSNSAGTPGEDN